MLFDCVNPVDLHFVHDTVDQEKIFFRKIWMVAPPRCENPWNYESHKPFIKLQPTNWKIPHFGVGIVKTTFVKLDFVEIFHYSKVSPIDSQYRRFKASHSRPYITCDEHIYTFDMWNNWVTIKKRLV